jgi:lipopolysaccharide/colanic/teichoic acid biosynthesis glycosyltransferase
MVLKTDVFDAQDVSRRDACPYVSGALQPRQPGWYARCKLLLGWPIALVLLVLATPLLGLMALAVMLTSRGPAFYSQVRQGRNGRPYRMYKIRTMVADSERVSGPKWATPDDPRITPVGRVLRKLHLDELPQLWNVLKGDMSLVGPRPERPEIASRLERCLPHYRERWLVRPGLTGLAQIHLPADTDLQSVRRKLAHDLFYLEHMGPWLDLRLLLSTALYLLRVPFHVSAGLLRLPSSEQIERRLSLLPIGSPVHGPHFDLVDRLATHGLDVAVANGWDGHERSEWDDIECMAAIGRRLAVTVVVPCFNEEAALPQLARTLDQVQARLESQYDLRWILVDDGSSDATWQLMKECFADWSNVRIAQHERNRGVAAAIRTGIELAQTEIVCSIDADCTYDPHELARMVPLLANDVALVTASPYHAEGRVLDVSRWRRFLSRGASCLYGLALRNKLSTYTSCFRVYRRSAVLPLELSEDGFEGVAELLARLDLQGMRIVEHPATLSRRRLGQSKLHTFRAIRGHLRLLRKLVLLRWRQPAPPVPASLTTTCTPSLERIPA